MAGAVIVLGLIVLLANLVVPNTAWTDFVAAAQNTPTFANPFDERISQSPVAIADGAPLPTSVSNAGGVQDCDASDKIPFLGCVRTEDGAESYVTGPFELRMDFIPTNTALPILTAVIIVQCRSDSHYTISFNVNDNTDNLEFSTDTVSCLSQTGEFVRTVIQSSFVPTRPTVGGVTNGYIEVNEPAGDLDISYVSVAYIIGTDPECTSADSLAYIGCFLSNAISGMFRFLRLVINAFVFLAQGFVYLGGLIVGFFGLFAVVFDLGAPSPYQEIIDIAVIAILIYLVVAFVKIARGTGPI